MHNPFQHNLLRRNSIFVLTLALAPLSAFVAAHPSVAAPRAAKSASWVKLVARTDKSRYQVGQPIKVDLRATNIQQKDAYLKFSSGQRFDIQLFKAGAAEPVYTWSANKMFVTTTSHVKLTQGQSENYNAEIGSEMGELAPGKYRLQADLTNSSQIRALPVEFSIVAKNTVGNAQQKLAFAAATDKKNYRVGEAVKINLSLRNTAKNAASLNFNSGQTYDVFIRNAAGDLVWSWAANKRFIMATRQTTLAAGATQNFAVEWDGRALPDFQITPGQYTVEAIFTSTPELRAQPINIQIG